MAEACGTDGLAGARGLKVRRTMPRAAELHLLRECLEGPRVLTEGPVGRCTKHGWLRSVIEPTGSDRRSPVLVTYEITDAGREAVAAAGPWA